MANTRRRQKRICIVNFKGGVGKTTLALHLACGLATYGESEVLLVDVDHQSTLSVVCLGGRRWDTAVGAGKTVDAIFQHFVKQNRPVPGLDIVSVRPYASGSNSWTYGGQPPKLDLVPSTLELDETELDLSSTTVGGAIESEWAKRSLICQWIDQNDIANKYD
ncbi:MAG: AAA family ATPase [Chloroflexi bacterium]|nr:AAA family ATPase [Chloroflexota bacterium]